jgi:type IV secretion system protein TrbB
MAELIRFSARDEQARRLRESMRRVLGEFYQYLEQDDVIELSLNPDGGFWVDRLGQPMQRVGEMNADAAEVFIDTIASIHRTTINRNRPILECELPLDGSRFEALVPPVVAAPVFSIRRRASSVYTLAQYVADGIITDDQKYVIESSVETRQNILVTGGAASGKTTLLNALIAHLAVAAPDHRLVVIEDMAELQCDQPNAVMTHTSDNADMRMLTRAAMRLRPDRIIVGETRGGECLELLKAWNTGHSGGLSTLHANSTRDALKRIELLLLEVTENPLPDLIASAINVVIHIEKRDGIPGRKVTEILSVAGYRGGEYQVNRLA